MIVAMRRIVILGVEITRMARDLATPPLANYALKMSRHRD
jgi:hypothetical protein